jgi:phospholipid/cholesterol/gamma-HCH transport system substrate-binding protein
MVVLGTFLLVSAGMFLYMLAQTGTRVPLLEEPPHPMTVYVEDIDNLVPASQVQIAGVKVGEVITTEATPQGGRIVFTVQNKFFPLHEGVKIRLSERSLVGESYLEVRDGTGPPIPEGATLPKDAVLPAVTLYHVLEALDPETRKVTATMLQSLDKSTTGTRDQLAATFNGLGDLGRGGHTAIDAIAAQSEDLQKLAAETTTLLAALDNGQGQIADLVTGADKVTKATAGQRPALEESVRLLPETVQNAHDVSASLRDLSVKLAPVASDLKAASPKLSEALHELPGTTEELRGLLPPTQEVLDRAPATLERVDTFSDDLSDLVPSGREILRDLNPALRYLEPYGPDMAAFFANFNAALKPTDEAGRHYIRAMLFFNEKTAATPVRVGLGAYSNPYPRPGAGNRPGPFKGPYPRLERLPK